MKDLNMILGTLDENLSQETGGSMFGLIKYKNDEKTFVDGDVQLWPTLFEQFGRSVSSFQIDSPNRVLTLAGDQSLIDNANTIILLVDLRPLGDFVEHYACVVINWSWIILCLAVRPIY